MEPSTWVERASASTLQALSNFAIEGQQSSGNGRSGCDPGRVRDFAEAGTLAEQQQTGLGVRYTAVMAWTGGLADSTRLVVVYWLQKSAGPIGPLQSGTAAAPVKKEEVPMDHPAGLQPQSEGSCLGRTNGSGGHSTTPPSKLSRASEGEPAGARHPWKNQRSKAPCQLVQNGVGPTAVRCGWRLRPPAAWKPQPAKETSMPGPPTSLPHTNICWPTGGSSLRLQWDARHSRPWTTRGA